MPRNAIATGAVDFVLPPAEIARELVRVGLHPYVTPPATQHPDQEILPDGDGELRKIFFLLQNTSKIDFSHYKQSTIRRRIGRRMIVCRAPALSDYLRYLEQHPTEIRELYRDLLISVTNFFRDPAAFEALAVFLPDMVQAKKEHQPFRLWVPGCATGEELYSLAIVLSEVLERSKLATPVQLFGTDISEMALERARAGIYPDSIADDVSPERLRRFFTRVDSGYQIAPSIRESCVFARQDLATDPPFAHTDLITCRNVLIYMDASLQRRILPVLHYSLNPMGLLMLGMAETNGAAPDLFEPIDKQNRIYRRKAVPVRLTLDLGSPRDRNEISGPAPLRVAMNGIDLVKKVDRVIQSKYSPAAVVVDRDLKILHFRGHTSFYLDPSPGDATLDLLRMAREGLVVALRRTIEAASTQGISIREEGIHLEHRGEHRVIGIEVTPVSGASADETYFLIVFDDNVDSSAGSSGISSIPKELDASEFLAALQNQRSQLQQQLAETREYLRYLNEDHEASAEELRAANEEVRSANEELQSTNEELSTTKEELHSANEELTTVNEELQGRNQELDAMNNDLGNLLSAVRIPIVMVDSNLRVRRFNSAAEKLLELGAVDIGRPVANLRGSIEIPKIENVVRAVVETLATQHLEVRDHSGRWFSLTIRPYRTADNRIDGAVLVFVDIDPLKRSLTLAEETRDYAEGMIETVREPLVVLDSDLRVHRATSAFYETFHVSREETIGRFLYDLGNGQWNQPRLRELLGETLFHGRALQDYEIVHEFPHLGMRTMRLNARPIPRQEEDQRRSVLLSMEDVTQRRERAEIRYQRLFETARDGIIVLNAENNLVADVNPFLLALTGYALEDFIGRELKQTAPFRESQMASNLVEETRVHETVRYASLTILTKKGQTIDVELIANRYAIDSQAVVQVNIRDVTERRAADRARARAEQALEQATKKLRRANGDLEEFTNAARHDIREPLKSVAVYTEMFDQQFGAAVGPEGKQLLRYVNQSVTRLQAQLDSLLSYARATARLEAPDALIDPRKVLERVVENLKGLIEKERASITYGYLPPVRMHETHLAEIFQNLLANAIQYRGSEAPRVVIASVPGEADYTFSVTDNGAGIAREHARAIFGVFKRLHGQDIPGSGTGLAICEKIIEHYGGRIWIESVVGTGSTVFFSVPNEPKLI
jgi:PAS domain S-box-containing protein